MSPNNELAPVPPEHLLTRYAEQPGSLLDLDELLGNLVTAVLKHAETGEAEDLAGVEEVKAIQAHVRKMIAAEKTAAPQHGSWVDSEDVRRCAHEIDVAINGEAGAAASASLSDVTAQIVGLSRKLRRPLFPTLSMAAGFNLPDGWSKLAVEREGRAVIVCGPDDAIAEFQRRINAGAADAARLDHLEELALDGVIEMGVELDGGVFLTIHRVGEQGVAYRERNTIREAIDMHLTGVPGQVVPPEPAPAPRAPTPERLLEIARETGLRQHMHGVNATIAREQLRRFFELASHPDSAGPPPPDLVKVRGVTQERPAPESAGGWMRLQWWRDEARREEAAEAYVRIDLLNEEQAMANHGMSLDRIARRGGMSPNEVLANLRRQPCRPSIGEEEAYRAVVAHVQRLEGASA